LIVLVNYYQKKRNLLFFNSGVWYKALIFAVIRYMIFSTQFLVLLLFLHKESDILPIVFAIYLTYFFAAFIPMLSFLDWTVKGSVAIWVFKDILPENIVVQAIGLMWIFNFLLPFVVGSIYLYRQSFTIAK